MIEILKDAGIDAKRLEEMIDTYGGAAAFGGRVKTWRELADDNNELRREIEELKAKIAELGSALKKPKKRTLRPEEVTRDSILQEIAPMVYRQFEHALVTGSPDNIKVEAHQNGNDLFLRASLKPHPEILDKFTIVVHDIHDGRWLLEELDERVAGSPVKIAEFKWTLVRGPEAASKLKAYVKVMKSKRVADPVFIVENHEFVLDKPGNGDFRFNLKNLEWVLKKDVSQIRYFDRGVLSVAVQTELGKFEYFLRGRQ